MESESQVLLACDLRHGHMYQKVLPSSIWRKKVLETWLQLLLVLLIVLVDIHILIPDMASRDHNKYTNILWLNS